MALSKYAAQSTQIKQAASQRLGADIADGKIKWRIKGMSSFESSKGDTIKLELEVISSVVKEKFNRDDQGKKAERVYFLPVDDAKKTTEMLEQFFKDMKTVFGKMPEGDLSDENFKKWAADIRGLVVQGQLSKKPSEKNPEDVFVNIYLNEKSALTPDDMKALEKAGAAVAPQVAGSSMPAERATAQALAATIAAKPKDLENDIPF